jgi:hypothetical protein
MHKLNLDQFRTTLETGGVLSVSLVAQGGAFHIAVETRRGEAVLTKARGSDLRQFRDATKALGLLRELGIREAKVNTKNWRPEQADIGRATRSDRAEAMKAAHEAAEHDRWFRDQVQAAMDDPKPSIPHGDIKRRWAKQRADLLKQAEAEHAP